MHFTRPLLGMRYRKLRLTTKDVNKGYYKGTRTGRMGQHTKYGGYVIDWSRVRTYVCPDLTGFTLTPFVASSVRRTFTEKANESAPKHEHVYLARWKEENGES